MSKRKLLKIALTATDEEERNQALADLEEEIFIESLSNLSNEDLLISMQKTLADEIEAAGNTTKSAEMREKLARMRLQKKKWEAGKLNFFEYSHKIREIYQEN